MACRLQAMGVTGYGDGFRLTLHPQRLGQPLERRKPTTYFVNSMSDLFHEDISDLFLDKVMSVIRRTPHHTYQILTKRAERLPIYFAHRDCPANVWLGVSVEDRRYGLPRIDYLQQVGAHIRFLSVEPLLEDLGPMDLAGIHWVIVGGESGWKARPMQPEWLGNVQRQAQTAGAAFFFKQWGAWGADGRKRGKKANGRVFKGKTWDATPRMERIEA
jgi:protein gp37